MPTELTDADVMRPQPAAELSDEDVMKAPAPSVPWYEPWNQPEHPHKIGWAGALAYLPVQTYRSMRDLYLTPGKATKEGLTPEEEMDFAANVAFMDVTGRVLSGAKANQFVEPRPDLIKTIAPTINEFQDTVVKPGIEKTIGDIISKPPEMEGFELKQLPEGAYYQALNDHVTQLNEAKQLGIIDETFEPEPTFKDSPAKLAQDAVPQQLGAAVTPEGMRGRLGHEPGAYDALGKEWIDKIDAPEDVRNAIENIAKENDYFPESRAGAPSPAARAAVAEAAGIDPKEMDSGYFNSTFDNDGKVRAVIQALRQTTNDFMEASEKARKEPTEENAAAALEAQERQRHVLEYTMGIRAESGRSLAAWKDLLRETERTRATTELRTGEETGIVPKGVGDLVTAAGDVQANLKIGKKLGLNKLIAAAEKLANAPEIEAAPGKAPLPPALAGLIDQAKDTLRKLKVSDEAEVESFRQSLAQLASGSGKLGDTVDAARALLAKKAKPETEVSEPKVVSARGKLMGAAKRLVAAADKTPRVIKEPVSAEMQSLMEVARQAVGRLKTGHLQQEFEAFRTALNQNDAAGAKVAAQRLIDAEAKPVTEGLPKPPVEYDQAMAAARRVAKAGEEVATKGKPTLPPDLASLIEEAKNAASELGSARKSELDRLVDAAERQAVNMVKQRAVKRPVEALPPELQALVDKTERVVDTFGGIAKGEKAAMMLARAGRTAAEQADLARQVNGLTPNQVARVLQRLRKDNRPGWLFWSVQQGLISGLITHTKYAIVNAASTLFDRVISPEIAAVIGKARGEDVSLLAPLHAVPELFRAVPDAMAGTVQAFKTGARVPLASELRLAERGEINPQAKGAQVPYGTRQGPNWGVWQKVFNDDQLASAERVIGVPGRSANAFHTFFKILNERAAAGSRAFEKAIADGEKVGTDKFNERYQYHLDNPTDEALRQTVDDAYSGTFMEKLGDQSEKFATLVRNTPLKWLIFFTHIPMNIIRKGIEYSPLAILNTLGETKIGSALKGELGPQAQNLALARMVIGTSIGGYFIMKALNGDATGDYPTDPKERRRWQMMNIQPNSLKIGDQWVSIERLGPQVMAARIAANYAAVIQHYKDSDKETSKKLTEAGLALVLGTAHALASEVGFETIKNIVNVMENPAEGARFAAYQLSSYLMPVSFITQAASFLDPNMRKAENLLAGLKYHIPGLRETLLPKRDPVYGESVHNPGYHTMFREAPIQYDFARMEMNRLKYYPTPPSSRIANVKLTPELYDEYQVTAGQLVKRLLQNYTESEKYQNLSDPKKAAELRGLVQLGRAQARRAMLSYHPEIWQEALATKQKAIAASRGTNKETVASEEDQ